MRETRICAAGTPKKACLVFGLARFSCLSAESAGFSPVGNMRLDEWPLLELHPQFETRAVALQLVTAEPGVEALEAEDDVVA